MRRIGIVCNNLKEALDFMEDNDILQSEAFIIRSLEGLRKIRRDSVDFIIELSLPKDFKDLDHFFKITGCMTVREYLQSYGKTD